MRVLLRVVLLVSLLTGCGKSAPAIGTLQAPAGTKPEVVQQLEQGNARFASRDWAGAEQAFRRTITADPTLAEAHYNLAVTLDRMGNQSEARKHYMEAANLAPGNKIIWDSPPLRAPTSGLTHDIDKKSYQDPTYKGF